MRLSLLLLTLLCLPVAIPASADELEMLRDRVAQLEATVEELTLQLADAVKERRRLEAEIAEALADAEAAAAAPVAAAPIAAAPAASEALSTGAPPASDRVIEETPVAPAAQTATGSAPAASAEALATAGPAYASTSDCDVSQALAGYDGKREGNEALAAWLEADDHLARCSMEQLREIRAAVKWDWLGYQKPVLKLLDEELARR